MLHVTFYPVSVKKSGVCFYVWLILLYMLPVLNNLKRVISNFKHAVSYLWFIIYVILWRYKHIYAIYNLSKLLTGTVLKKDPRGKLFIGGLNSQTNVKALEAAFGKFGPMMEGKSRTYMYIYSKVNVH